MRTAAGVCGVRGVREQTLSFAVIDQRAAVGMELEVTVETALAVVIVEQLAKLCTNGEGQCRIRKFTFEVRTADGRMVGGSEVVRWRL
jgi:hypothetical protein